MSARRWLPTAVVAAAVVVLCLIVLAPWDGPPPGSEPPSASAAMAQILARPEIQFDRPEWPDPEWPDPEWPDPEDDRAVDDRSEKPRADWRIEERDIREPSPRRVALPLPDWNLSPLLKLIVWTAIGGAALLFLYVLVVALSGAGWPATRRDEEETPGPAGSAALLRPDRVLADAERLAAAGRYEEALHALLLHGIGALRQRLGSRLAVALTSREIVAASNLPPAGQAALQDLVARVELTYFGERTAGPADYEICRALFETFSQAIAAAPANGRHTR